jgi:DNA-binding beta-propeller fold protein YncE
MCYISNNTVAVSLGQKLQFANISGDMNLMQSVDTDHYCKGLTYHDSKILTVNDNSVFIHNYNGKQERCLFTYDSNAYFQGIAVSDDGQRIYITSWNMGLVTIDNKGNHLFTLSDPELNDPFRLSLDNHGNVLICYPHSNIVMQVSPDGKNEMGRIIKATDSIEWPNSLYFDRNTSSIIVGCGGSAYLYVFDLK